MSVIQSKNPNRVFCPSQPGKPNPNEPAVAGTMRSRIIQKAQKGNTCAFYAMQILRNENKIGKVFSLGQVEARSHEKLLSDHRKQLTEASHKRNVLMSFADQLTQHFRSFTKNKAEDFIATSLDLLNPEYYEIMAFSLFDFCEQSEHKEFSDYVEAACYRAEISIYEDLLNKIGTTNDFIINSYDATAETTWEKASLFDRKLHLQTLVLNYSRKAYDLKDASWHPDQPLNTLIEQLKLHGPHYVLGQFGHEYNETSPVELADKLEGRSIFEWPSNAARKTLISNHAIVLVGAEITDDNKEYVYFVDPNDESQPYDLSTQKIYKISYQIFKESTANLSGDRMTNLENGEPAFTPMNAEGKNNYALHA